MVTELKMHMPARLISYFHFWFNSIGEIILPRCNMENAILHTKYCSIMELYHFHILHGSEKCWKFNEVIRYSEIPLLRPPKIKIFYPLKTFFAKLKLFFSSFSTPSVPLIRDHLWDCPKVVFKTTFGQSQRWS